MEDKSISKYTLKDFKVDEVLNIDNSHKVITLLGHMQDKPDRGVLRLAKSDLLDNIDYTSQLQNLKSEKMTFNNDKYNKFDLIQNLDTINLQNVELIYPATKDIINKYKKSDFVIFNETAEFYNQICKKYIDSLPIEKIQWVYNILEGKSEKENVQYRNEDPKQGFLIAKDYKMNNEEKETLHLLVIVNNRNLRSLRDLTQEDLPMLENIRDESYKVCKEKFDINREYVRLHFHYHPQFYHLHIHVTHSNIEEASLRVERSHLLKTVIQNIKLVPDYYQKVDIEFCIRNGEAHTSCMTEAEAYQGKLYNPKIKNKDLFNKDIPTIPWVGWKRTIRKLVKRQEKKYIDKKILKERVLASFKKYKQDDFDPRDANVKFLLKFNKTKNLKVSGNKIIYEREE